MDLAVFTVSWLIASALSLAGAVAMVKAGLHTPIEPGSDPSEFRWHFPRIIAAGILLLASVLFSLLTLLFAGCAIG